MSTSERQQIRIDSSGVVIVEGITEKRRVGLDEFMSQLQSRNVTDSGALPPNCANVREANGRKVYTIVEPPQFRKIYHNVFPDGLEIAIPSLVYLLPIENNRLDDYAVRIGFTSEDVGYKVNDDTKLVRPWLPNGYDTLGICPGGDFGVVCTTPNISNAKRVHKALDYLHLAHYNNDLSYWSRYIPPAFAEYDLSAKISDAGYCSGDLLSENAHTDYFNSSSERLVEYMSFLTADLRSKVGDQAALQFVVDGVTARAEVDRAFTYGSVMSEVLGV